MVGGDDPGALQDDTNVPEVPEDGRLEDGGTAAVTQINFLWWWQCTFLKNIPSVLEPDAVQEHRWVADH